MLLYSSDSLKISFDKKFDRCILDWVKPTYSINQFKKDILQYTEIAIAYNMKQAIWLQQNLFVPIDKELAIWLEKNMNEPIIKDFKARNYYPLDKDFYYPVALVLGYQAYNLYTLSQINEHSDDDSKGKRKPKVFAAKNEAILWLNNWKSAKNIITQPSSPNIDQLLENYFNSQIQFINSHQGHFNSITNREKEILLLLIRGISIIESADILCISTHTVRTHWKNIKKKLNIKSILDLCSEEERSKEKITQF